MTVIVIVACLWLALGGLALFAVRRREILALWREPVFRVPVLTIESDDWGAGPREQARGLRRIAAVLSGRANDLGQHPVMTLGIVLAGPDGPRIAADRCRNYFRRRVDDPSSAEILDAIIGGAKAGVFALQLHGGEHYWPPSLLIAARSDPRVAAWLTSLEIPDTEALPAALQSRWIDSAELPSRPLPPGEIRVAALAEVAFFREVFGQGPIGRGGANFHLERCCRGLVGLTLGIQVIITPGRRYEARGPRSEPVPAGPRIANGESGAAGIMYLVRDDYFEPARGHTADDALTALVKKTSLGRPTLFETHRANFLGAEEVAEASIRRAGSTPRHGHRAIS